jgi:aerobic carbon-monoxide dehydrogenase medium subunit
MIPGQFEYVRPANLDETLRILSDREGEAKLLSGGYSLIPLLKLRLADPGLLVDLRDVGGLDTISRKAHEFRIGGKVTHRQIQENADLTATLPLVHDAASGIGDPQVRNWGTIGGSCAHADPSSDWPAVLLALRASIVCRSISGERVIAARDFFLDSFQTAIAPTEVLTEVRLPIPGSRSGGAYAKLERRTGDFATVGCAIQLRLDESGRISEIGIGLTAVNDTPFAATKAEAAVEGAMPTEEMYRQAGIAAAGESRPAQDAHGPIDYKLAMVREMVVRGMRRAVERAGSAG